MFYKSKESKEKEESVFFSVILLFFSQIFIKLLGLVKNRLLSSYFGTGSTKDTFDAAFLFPDMVFTLSSEYISLFSFLPVFSKIFARDKKKAEKFSKVVLLFLTTWSLIVSFLIFFTIPFFKGIYRLQIPTKLEKDFVLWSKLLTPSGFILSIGTLFSAKLIAKRNFFKVAIAPLFYNLGIVIGVFPLSNFLGVNGVIFGVWVGAVLNLLTLIDIKKPVLEIPNIKELKIEIKEFIKLSIPFLLFGFFMRKGFDFIVSFVSLRLEEGVLSSFNYAYNVLTIPNSLIGVSISQSVYSSFTGNTKDSSLEKSIRMMIFLSVPFSFILFILRAQIVRILYGSGNFDWVATKMTLDNLSFLSLGLLSMNLIPVLNRFFYAQRNPKTPIFVFLLSNLTFLFMSFLIVKANLPFWSLPLAFSLATVIQSIALFFCIAKISRGLSLTKFSNSFFKSLISSILMSFALYGGLFIWDKFFSTNKTILLFLQTSISLAAGLFTFLATSEILKIEEWLYLKEKFTKRLKDFALSLKIQ